MSVIGGLRVAYTNDFDVFHLLDDSTLDTAGGNRSTTFDRETRPQLA